MAKGRFDDPMTEYSRPGQPLAEIAAYDALAFLLEAGADEAIADEAVDRLRRIVAQPAESRSAPAMPGTPANRAMPVATSGAAEPPMAASEAVATARQMARAAGDLPALEVALAAFDGCALKSTATRLVFSDGVPGSRLMVIGEAPGRDEDIEGRPFVGRSGQLLDQMLKAIGLDRTTVYIANVVPWRPPGNRKPTAAEVTLCRPFLDRQIELAAPELILMLGGAATSALLSRDEGIMRLRGHFYEIGAGDRIIPAFASLHPAYLLRAPAEKKLAWRDFLAIKARLNQIAV